MNRFSQVSLEWTETVFSDPPLVINVLVVADGKVTFNNNPIGFSLSVFCKVLESSALPGEQINVITAHRAPADLETGAKIKAFKFDSIKDGVPEFSIENFDELWMFGDDGEDLMLAIAPSELAAITEFMNKGGGVFAAGDHEDLGSAMCGDVPRVRHMRRWHIKNLTGNEPPAPSRNDSTRIDTLREGINPGFQTDDEKDAIPQEIRPKFFVNESRTASEPHELLATKTFPITILPDHMHEGECVSPDEIKKRAQNEPRVANDFPKGSNDQPVWPQVVAISSSGGGSFFPTERIFPVDPRCYVIISAYDGHLVERADDGTVDKLGRVVVDASFHHFLNFNLVGFLDDNNLPKPEFETVSQYYRNILRYLLPPKKQHAYFLHLLRALRFSPPLMEDLQNLSLDNWEHVVYAGTATKNAISKDFSAAHARRCALAMIPDVKPSLRTYLQDMINLWQEKNKTEYSLFFLNSDAILVVLLGQAILGLASSLPTHHYEVKLHLTQLEVAGKSLQELVAENLQQGTMQLQKRIGELKHHLEKISEI